MRSRIGKIYLVIALAGLAALLWALGAGSVPPASGKPAAITVGAEATISPARAPTSAPLARDAAERRVEIDNFTFNPRSLSVAPGTKVTWINQDDVPHTATSSDAPRRFNSGPLDTDGSFSFTFLEKGTYAYFCAIHPHMTGDVIVK